MKKEVDTKKNTTPVVKKKTTTGALLLFTTGGISPLNYTSTGRYRVLLLFSGSGIGVVFFLVSTSFFTIGYRYQLLVAAIDRCFADLWVK